MENFKKLKVWVKAHLLTLEIYKVTESFPKNELFGLVSQVRRATISVPANIAEGSKRITPKDRRHFINIAASSLEEVKYYIILGRDLNYVSDKIADSLIEQSREVGRMLTGLSKSLD